jgi:hypothetical protein
MDIVAKGAPNMRIIRKYPLTPWKQVWQNLHNASISDRLKSVRYIAINELTPTNERRTITASGIGLTQQHRILECGTGKIIWMWTCMVIASWLRCSSREMSEEWVVQPCFQFWPPQKHAAVICLLAHLVYYRETA